MNNDDSTGSNIIVFDPNGELSILVEKRRRIKRQAKRDRHVADYLTAYEILLMITDSFEDWADHLENLNDSGSVELEDIELLVEYLRDMKVQIQRWLKDD